MQSLHPRVRVQWVLSGLIAATILAVLLAVAGAVQRVVPIPGWLPYVVGAVAAVLAAGHAFARYDRWRYELQDDALYLERGVLTQIETAVPYVRIQHVDTRRSPVARLLGLASVVVYTAGSRGADVSVPGLTPANARSLGNQLRELAVESEPEDGV